MVITLIKRFACTCLVFTSLSVNAIPMYDIDSGGQITGVSGLTVGTETYDATFLDGSFESIFTSDPSVLYTESFANNARQSLFEFLDTSLISMGSSSSDINGCSIGSCGILTTYELLTGQSGTLFENASIVQLVGNPIIALSGIGSLGQNATSNSPGFTHTKWVERETVNVPEPSIALLMASGLVAFGLVRRKTRV